MGTFSFCFLGPRVFIPFLLCTSYMFSHRPPPPTPFFFSLGPIISIFFFFCALLFTRSHWPLLPLGWGAQGGNCFDNPPFFVCLFVFFAQMFLYPFHGPKVFRPFFLLEPNLFLVIIVSKCFYTLIFPPVPNFFFIILSSFFFLNKKGNWNDLSRLGH